MSVFDVEKRIFLGENNSIFMHFKPISSHPWVRPKLMELARYIGMYPGDFDQVKIVPFKEYMGCPYGDVMDMKTRFVHIERQPRYLLCHTETIVPVPDTQDTERYITVFPVFIIVKGHAEEVLPDAQSTFKNHPLKLYMASTQNISAETYNNEYQLYKVI